MTENLRLGGSSIITLRPQDSNVSSDWEVPAVQTSGTTAWAVDTKHIYSTGSTTYGNYYSWYTATAGTGTSSMSSASTSDPTNTTDSICPKGWRLPDGGTSPTKSWYALDRALGGSGTNRTDATQLDKYLNSPYYFGYSGLYNYNGGVNKQGSSGYWWSRSAGTTAGGAYNFGLSSTDSFVRFQYSGDSVAYGFSVRCVNSE